MSTRPANTPTPAKVPGAARAYFSAFRIRLIADLQYRGAAWAGVATQFAWGFMLLMLYHAFYDAGGEPPMPFEQLASYIWLQQAFLSLLMLWWQDQQLLSSIVDGSVAYELCRGRFRCTASGLLSCSQAVSRVPRCAVRLYWRWHGFCRACTACPCRQAWPRWACLCCR